MNETLIDKSAIGFSLACILHCVALPAIAISTPFLIGFAEAEWVHWLLTLLAVAATSTIILVSHDARTGAFLAPATGGLVLLGSALFLEPYGVDETLPVVTGGLLLAGAHTLRLLRHR